MTITDNHAPLYPECEKLSAVREQSQIIGEFLSSLWERGQYICEMGDDENLHLTSKSIEQVLADYFEIDLTKIETEKRDMLRMIREQNRGTK